MTALMRQSQEMEHKEKAVKAAPRLTQLEGRVGRGTENVGEKRRFRDACDARSEATEQELRGEGGWAGRRPLSEEGNEAQKQQHGAGVGRSMASGGAVKKTRNTTTNAGNARGPARASIAAS